MRKRRFRIPPHIDQQITPEVREYIVQLAEGYEKKIRELEKRIEELEARFAKLTPQNSSLRPSVQHPHAKPKPAAKKSDGPRKKQGAKHYLKVTPQHLADAKAQGVGQHVGHSLQETTSREGRQGKAIPAKSGKTIIPLISANDLIGRAGLEPATKGL